MVAGCAGCGNKGPLVLADAAAGRAAAAADRRRAEAACQPTPRRGHAPPTRRRPNADADEPQPADAEPAADDAAPTPAPADGDRAWLKPQRSAAAAAMHAARACALRFSKMHGAGNDFVVLDLRGGAAAARRRRCAARWPTATPASAATRS